MKKSKYSVSGALTAPLHEDLEIGCFDDLYVVRGFRTSSGLI